MVIVIFVVASDGTEGHALIHDHEHKVTLSDDAEMIVYWKRGKPQLVSYAVVLVVEVGGRKKTVRVYDNAHGQHEMHRYNAVSGKQKGEKFHDGTPHEALQAAISSVQNCWDEMIAAWRATSTPPAQRTATRPPQT